jgi:hypothetical protein
MSHKRILTIGLVLMVAMLITSTTVYAKGNPAKIAPTDPQVTGFTAFSISAYSYPRAGMVFNMTDVNIPGVGRSVVTIDGSWDWSIYDGSHPCALVDSLPSPAMLDLVSNDPGFIYNAAVTIVDRKGSVIAAGITGGSVCEIVVPGSMGDGSINEWVMAFETDGALSTGKYAGRTGTGHIVFRLDSSTGADPVFLDPRFIVLQLNK